MKLTKLTGLVLLTLLTVASAPDADARPRPNGSIGGKKFEANKGFGLGLELGSPTGLTGKYFLDNGTNALQFGLGGYYGFRDYYGYHLYFDYLWHPVSLVSASAFELPLFIGVGARLWNFDDRGRTRDYDGITGFGIRVPVGVSFDFNNVPIDIFIQVVPVIDFYRGYYHSVGFWFDSSIGIRYYFN
jgi:hypothetical protein